MSQEDVGVIGGGGGRCDQLPRITLRDLSKQSASGGHLSVVGPVGGGSPLALC
jgi:hypothetical protein